jgi:hypothetical protein
MMKRRKVLTGASALAGAVITGCGGGEENVDAADAGADSISEIAYPITQYLLPENSHYQVEVVFGLPRAVTVYLNGPAGVYKLASKPQTGGHSHKMGFAKVRVPNHPNWNHRNISLVVLEEDGVTRGWTHNAGAKALVGTTSNHVEYKVYTNPSQFEWRFYSKDPSLTTSSKRLFCCVRFFKLPQAEFYDVEKEFDSVEQYVKVIPNNASIDNLNGTVLEPSQHLLTTCKTDAHVSRAKKHGTTHRDTIALPDHQQPPGYRMLVPTLHHATPVLRKMLERVHLRHITALAKAQAVVSIGDPINYGADDNDVHNHLSNELLRLLGGESLIENMRKQREDLFLRAETLFGSMTEELSEFIKNKLADTATDEARTEARELIENAINDLDPGRTGGVSVKLTIAPQIGGSVTYPNWPIPGVALGVGLRASFPLFRVSVQAGKKFDASPVNYYVPGAKPVEFSIVPIIKLASAGSLLSIDLEVTINFVMAGGKLKMSSWIFDPVIDYDVRSILGRLAHRGFKEIASHSDNPLARIIAYDPVTPDDVMEAIMVDEFGFAGRCLDGVPEPLTPRVTHESLSETLKRTESLQRDDRTKVVELSPLRFKFAHRDLGVVPFTADTPFWSRHQGNRGYCPGVKILYGPTIRTPAPAIPGAVKTTGFFRFVAVLDISWVRGDEAFLLAENLMAGN